MRTFADFSNQLLALKETLKKEEIANVAGDGAVSMPPTAKRVKKRKSKQFSFLVNIWKFPVEHFTRMLI